MVAKLRNRGIGIHSRANRAFDSVGHFPAGLETSRIVTIDYLHYHALARPEAIALIEGGRAVTYAEMARDLWKTARAIREFQLPPGSSVAIGCDDFYTHWLLILAFELHGITTASFQSDEGPSVRSLLGSVDLVFAEPHYPTGGWQTRPLTEDWRRSVADRPDEGPVPGRPKRPDDILRIVRTSGTTGEPKRFHLLRSMLEARNVGLGWIDRFSPPGTAGLRTLPLSIGGIYTAAVLALRNGRPMVVELGAPVASLPGLIRQHGLRQIGLLPIQLAQLLDRLPSDWKKPEWLEIVSFGAAVPESLRRAALERLATEITNVYGSNETNIVAVSRESERGSGAIVVPDVEVEIVDDEDRPVPDGVEGQIRARSPAVFRGYLDDPTLTRRMLRDGWFYPGDIGVLDGRRLQVIGRADDQVNVGGVKYALPRLEELTQKTGGATVKDVGIVPVPGSSGLPELNVALVTEGSEDRAVLDRIIAVLRPVIAGDLHLVRLPQIPRNLMGKIDRAQLKDAIVAARFPERG